MILFLLLKQRGDTALHMAAKHAHLDVLMMLLEAQASINEQNQVRLCTVTVLCAAIGQGICFGGLC